MIPVVLKAEDWLVVLAAVQGLHAQLLTVTGPLADAASPRAMSAVRVIGQVRWIEGALRNALGSEAP